MPRGMDVVPVPIDEHELARALERGMRCLLGTAVAQKEALAALNRAPHELWTEPSELDAFSLSVQELYQATSFMLNIITMATSHALDSQLFATGLRFTETMLYVANDARAFMTERSLATAKLHKINMQVGQCRAPTFSHVAAADHDSVFDVSLDPIAQVLQRATRDRVRYSVMLRRMRWQVFVDEGAQLVRGFAQHFYADTLLASAHSWDVDVFGPEPSAAKSELWVLVAGLCALNIHTSYRDVFRSRGIGQ